MEFEAEATFILLLPLLSAVVLLRATTYTYVLVSPFCLCSCLWRGVGLILNRPTKALCSSPRNPKNFQNFTSHRILWHMHKALNIDENKN